MRRRIFAGFFILKVERILTTTGWGMAGPANLFTTRKPSKQKTLHANILQIFVLDG